VICLVPSFEVYNTSLVPTIVTCVVVSTSSFCNGSNTWWLVSWLK
jgi:hypothetical protein